MVEYWDVCDLNGKKNGQIRPKGAAYPSGEYHPAMEAWILNSRGEILIQQRSMQCELLPGVWGLTTGRMLAGETTAQGCIREIWEELGLRVSPEELHFLKRIPRGELLWDIYAVHKGETPGELILQKEEVAQAQWLSPKRFRKLLESGRLFHYPEIEEMLGLVEAAHAAQNVKTGRRETCQMDFITERNRIYCENEAGKTIAEVTFPTLDDDTVAIERTFVDASLRGQGLAGQLMHRAAEHLRRTGKKARPVCSYAEKWFAEHPEYADLLE